MPDPRCRCEDCKALRHGCELWPGGRDSYGYGCVTIEGRTYRVHRLAWEREHGPIPGGMLVMHTCGEPACVALDHLRLATRRDVTRHALDHGAAFRSLTDAAIEQIRQSGGPLKALAERHGVSEATVSLTRRRKVWGWKAGA